MWQLLNCQSIYVLWVIYVFYIFKIFVFAYNSFVVLEFSVHQVYLDRTDANSFVFGLIKMCI